MGAAAVSVNVYVRGDTSVDVRQAVDGSQVWLEVGDVAGSIGMFFDPAGLERVRSALGELNNRMPAPDLMAAA
jgi:hypothetical protein